jgi:hypothetical protein
LNTHEGALRRLSVMVQLAPEPEAMSFVERYLGSMQFRTYLGTIEEFSRELWSRWTERRETAQIYDRCRRIRAT